VKRRFLFLAGAAAMIVAIAVHSAGSRPSVDIDAAKRTLAAKSLAFPVRGYDSALRDNFDERRGAAPHEALDIMAPRGTAVVAVEDGEIAKLFDSKAGGLTIYQFDPSSTLAYYYAHLDGYAPGIKQGDKVKRGQLIGYVGSTGNAQANAPHLHFTVFALGPGKEWWKGVAINPYRQLLALPQSGA
jgi:murein DD-endopeptidase MepM/ murein hydrolase activator NlpD